MTGGFVRTLHGDIPAAELGATLVHEHLASSPPRRAVGDDPDVRFGSRLGATAELADYRAVGGGALVEMTSPDLGRNAELAIAAAADAGVHVIQATGLQKRTTYPPGTSRRSASELCAKFVAEIEAGIKTGNDGSRHRAGVVKAGSGPGALTPTERKVLLAAGLAARRTGVPVLTHTEADTLAHEQLDALEAAGLDLGRVCLGHVDRRLEWPYLRSLARRGAWLSLDQWTKERKYGPDRDRAAMVHRLLDAGHERVVVSGDLARASYQRAYGGEPGLAGLLGRIHAALPDPEVRRRVLVTGPAELLAMVTPEPD